MLYWLYDIPTLLTVALFAGVFVGVCWLGTILSRSLVRSRFHKDRGMNEILGDFLQYFGVIYGLLLGLLAVATYQNHTDVEKAVAGEASSSRRPKGRKRCTTSRFGNSMNFSRIAGCASTASPPAFL